MIRSLRLRLFAIILVPLLAVAVLLGAWRIGVAQKTAQDLFDRNLMFTGLAVARDVARSDGEAISPETEALLGETAGGPVRYHVYGPDGVLVIGYAVPPIAFGHLRSGEAFAYYDATYRGGPARVLRLRDETTIDGFSGTFTITVWQDLDARNAFVVELVLRSLAIMAMLVAAVALLIWFGVRFGLKPLIDLEEAISRRSPGDLSPIQRTVPVEAEGIVSQLNTLLTRMHATFDAQAAFVSDAAHQLRNPIAGLRALGESIQTAGSLEVAQQRAAELAIAAARAGDLANRLLTLERARAEAGTKGISLTDLGELIAETVAEMRREAQARGVDIRVETEDCAPIQADGLMLREALTNLIDNALVHGGDDLSRIVISLRETGPGLDLTVENDGASVSASDVPNILARFGQIDPGSGSGLGLSIADAVARRHGGELVVRPLDEGFAVTISLPRQIYRPAA